MNAQTLTPLKANGKRMTQAEAIIHHIETTGSITQREAMLEYGVQSFTKRLCDIEAKGHVLIKQRKVHPVSGQRYTRVYLRDVNTFPDLSKAVGAANQ